MDFMNNYKKYDEKDKYSIERYGQKMVGKTFRELIDMDFNNIVKESEVNYSKDFENKNSNKGKLGQLVEERFFHYKPNSDSGPDFKEAGVELKVTPYKINKNKTFSAKERLVLNTINYCKTASEDKFEMSHFWTKNKLILLVYYLWLENQNNLDYHINYVRLFTPSENDLMIIKQDYMKIVKKIQDGKAHELSESDTLYLSACTKGANSSEMQKQPNGIPAKKRAFAYKQSYMTYVLNNYLIGKKPLYESILKNNSIEDFESYIINQINKYKNKTQNELCEIFGVDKSKNPKNLGSMLAFRMLNVKSNNAEEFVKANIVVKTIRIENNGKIKENMSFPKFVFKELVKQEWEESDLFNLLYSTKFLFIIYQANSKGEYVINRAKFWNMPYDDLENEVKQVWEKTKQIISNGVVLTKKGKIHTNNLPKKSDNCICHVRPHTNRSYYKYDGYEAGNKSDGDQLPDGRWITKQCFWLDRDYILSVINDE